MVKIMFICHGNICRSPMAEFIMKDILEKQGKSKEFYICSSATSTEEIGNPVHHGTATKLNQYGISVLGKYAVQLKKSDYNKYDYLIGMDSWNIKNILNIIGQDKDKKVYKLLEFADKDDDIADPWYTNDFNKTYDDILLGCNGILKKLEILNK